jgi:transposase
MYPDWVQAQKKPGTNVAKIGENYYLYEVTSVWDKDKKRARKITKAYLGRITENGLIQKRKKKEPVNVVPPTVLHYGGAMLASQIGSEILEKLREHFGPLAETIFTIAALRFLHNHPFKRIELEYAHSYLSVMFKGLKLSGKSISGILQKLGDDRETIVKFMRCFVSGAEHILFDGTSVISKSKKMEHNNVGYNAHRQYDPQVNLLYAFSLGSSQPAYYRIVAGNVRDVTAFELCVRESGIENLTIVADKGFASKENFELLENIGLNYIVPLKRNSEAYAHAKFETGNKADFDGHFIFNTRPIWYYSSGGVCFYLDGELRAQEEKDYCIRIEKGIEGYTKEGFLEKQFKFGTIALKTNLKLSPREIFCLYKERANIEQTFDFLKNLLEQDKSYVQSQRAMEGWAFINHVSLLLCYKLYNLLREKKLLSRFSVADLITHLKYIHKIKFSDVWETSEISKKTISLLSELGLPIT